MAQIESVIFCAAVMAAVWTVIGLPIALRLMAPPACWLYAPAIGWAVHSAVALPLLGYIGMSRMAALVGTVPLVLIALVACATPRLPAVARAALLPASTIAIVAGLLALAPMAAVLPKETAEGVTLASPIFDHSKIAMIDEMIRAGVPLKNSFFGEIGGSDRVAYYYLWHFSAAVVAVMTGATGWEADAALTWFTAFASLLTMAGLAIWISGRTASAFIALALAATASIRTLLDWIGPDSAPAIIGWASGLGGWIVQTSWAPQHVASATCVVLACLLLIRPSQYGGWLAPIVLALVVAAGFQSSTWVGGVAFPLIAIAMLPSLLWSLAPERRGAFLLRVLVAAGLAVAISFPFIRDQIAAAASRGGGAPIAIGPLDVLGAAIPESIRRILDVPAYWLVYLPVEFPALYPAGIVGIVVLLRERNADPDMRGAVRSLAVAVFASLATAWLLRSIVSDNNDLGWRALLPAAMLLIAFAAAAIGRWPLRPARICAALAAAGLVLTLPETIKVVGENLSGFRKTSERLFAATPPMWEAVRRHTAPDQRIANNPLFLAGMTPWPVNISWALLGNRRSCYAGSELAIPFAAIPTSRRAEIEAQFVRIFAGEPVGDDVRQMAERFRCDVVVVTAQDGAWQRDPFAQSGVYELVEERPASWRIYRRTGALRP